MKKIKILLGIAMVVSVLTIPVHGAEGDTAIPVISEIPQITPVETPVRELRVEGNKIFYFLPHAILALAFPLVLFEESLI